MNIGKMNTNPISINDIITQLKTIPDSEILWNNPIDIHRIIAFEEKYQLKLPQDYKDFLLQTNGLFVLGDEILGFSTETNIYAIEETFWEEHYDVDNEMPYYLIPFSPDGFGNHYCFDTLNNKIVFWQHDLDYTKIQPEIVYDNFTVVPNIMTE